MREILLAVVALGVLIGMAPLDAQHKLAFGSNAGLVLNPIKPDRVADFEASLEALRAALQKSENPVRKQQAAGWRVYRALEPGPANSVLFVFVMSPTLRGADYGFDVLFKEALPENEAKEALDRLRGSYAAEQSLLNLTPMGTMTLEGPPPKKKVPGGS